MLITLRLAAFFLIALGGVASATSFDCLKADAVPEKIVCGDAGLRILDDQLARAYNDKLTQSSHRDSERKSQIRWLAEIRDRCLSTGCMRSAYVARLSALKPSAERNCPVGEASLVGSWVRRSGPAFFEEMAFGANGTKKEFDSRLHHRPELSGGSWSLEDCTLYIQGSTGTDMAFAFKIIKYRNGQLHVAEDGEGGRSVYKKMRR